MSFVEKILGKDGYLSDEVKGYEHREEQIKMSKLIKEGFETNKNTLIEAGTGTGKSFAYLSAAVAALKEEEVKRVVVSTNTINLQHQLEKKDAPTLEKALDKNYDFKTIVVKGRGNYVCRKRMKSLQKDPTLMIPKLKLKQLKEWEQKTRIGSKDTLPSYLQKYWNDIKSESNICDGKNCPYKKDCYVQNARKRQQKADIIIVNHYLFFIDLMIKNEASKDEKFNKEAGVLKPYDAVIFDEAHNLESVITNTFTKEIKSKGVSKLLSEVKNTYRMTEKEMNISLKNKIAKIETIKKEANKFTKYVDKKLNQNSPIILPGRGGFDVLDKEKFTDFLQNVLINTYSDIKDIIKNNGDKLVDEEYKIVKTNLEDVLNKVGSLTKKFADIAKREWETSFAYWIEDSYGGGFAIKAAPINTDNQMDLLLDNIKSAVFTSATLSTNNNFQYLKEQLGLPPENNIESVIKAPFDYQKQSYLAVPYNGKSGARSKTSAKEYKAYSAKYMKAISHRVNGGVFCLFTSYSALRYVYNDMKDDPHFNQFNLLVQGDDSRSNLIKSFKKESKSILLATASFWEGVDVPGDDLKCVIIDKIPFGVPTDPLIKARFEKLESEGKQPFYHYSLPQATIRLKQGFGRLIRTKNDYGGVIVLDKRVADASYADRIIKSLPNAKKTGDLGEVINSINNYYKKEKVV
ncbi:MAG: ATP-dependent DNA helicase [Bacillota bacterium]